MKNYDGHPDQNTGLSALAETSDADINNVGTAHPQAGVEADDQSAATIEVNAGPQSLGTAAPKTANTLSPGEVVRRTIVLPNGHQLPEELATMFRRQVVRRTPGLLHERNYKLRQICGEEFWSLLTHTEARKGGMYIAHLVATDQLQLEFATCPHAVPKRYRRK